MRRPAGLAVAADPAVPQRLSSNKRSTDAARCQSEASRASSAVAAMLTARSAERTIPDKGGRRVKIKQVPLAVSDLLAVSVFRDGDAARLR